MNYEIQFAQLGEESKLIFQSLKLMNICKHNIYITVDNSSFYAVHISLIIPKAFIQYDPLQKK